MPYLLFHPSYNTCRSSGIILYMPSAAYAPFSAPPGPDKSRMPEALRVSQTAPVFPRVLPVCGSSAAIPETASGQTAFRLHRSVQGSCADALLKGCCCSPPCQGYYERVRKAVPPLYPVLRFPFHQVPLYMFRRMLCLLHLSQSF